MSYRTWHEFLEKNRGALLQSAEKYCGTASEAGMLLWEFQLQIRVEPTAERFRQEPNLQEADHHLFAIFIIKEARKHEASLQRFAYRRLVQRGGTWEDAREVVHDAYQTLLSTHESKGLRREFYKSFLYRVVMQRCSEKIRKMRGIRGRSLTVIDRETGEERLEDVPDQSIEAMEEIIHRQDVLKKVLREFIGDKDIVYFKLARLDGLPWTEIADIMGVTPGNARQKELRIRRRIIEYLRKNKLMN